MSFNKVVIYYGLCSTFHSLEHKPQYVAGLQDRLQKLGYRVDLEKVPYINFCMIAMSDREIFRCNLKNLRFNTHYVRDVVCQRAINAVLNASALVKTARTHLWIRSILSDEMYARRAGAPKDYWPEEVDIKPYATCNECVACCDILVTKKVVKDRSPSRCFGFNVCSSFDANV